MQLNRIESKSPQLPASASGGAAGVQIAPSAANRGDFHPLPEVLNRVVLGYLTPDDDIGVKFAQRSPLLWGDGVQREVAEAYIEGEAVRKPRPALAEVMENVHPLLHDAAMYACALDAGFAVADDVVANLSKEALASGNRSWFSRVFNLGFEGTPAREAARTRAVTTVLACVAELTVEASQALLTNVLHPGYSSFKGALEDAGLPAEKFPA